MTSTGRRPTRAARAPPRCTRADGTSRGSARWNSRARKRWQLQLTCPAALVPHAGKEQGSAPPPPAPGRKSYNGAS
eukprot:8722894-Pyramimonas_sp.AAC.1